MHANPTRHNAPRSEDTACFVEQFTRHSRRVYGYILTLVANPSDADEVFADTSRVLWEKYDTFEPGTHFGAWACQIAQYRAMNYIKKRARSENALCESFAHAVTVECERTNDLQDARRDALTHCMAKLKQRDRDIITQRYETDDRVESIATAMSMTANAVYKTLNRVHRALFQCINRVLESQGII